MSKESIVTNVTKEAELERSEGSEGSEVVEVANVDYIGEVATEDLSAIESIEPKETKEANVGKNNFYELDKETKLGLIMNKVIIRPANLEDVPFILNSWLKSHRNSFQVNEVPNQIYYVEHHKLIRRIVQQYPVLVACCKQDPSLLYGWVCAGEVDNIFCIHYVYIKHAFRNLGIASYLLHCAGYRTGMAALVTHRNSKMLPIEKAKKLTYDPYVLYNNLKPEIEFK